MRDPVKLRNTFHFKSSYLTVEDDPLLVIFSNMGRSYRAADRNGADSHAVLAKLVEEETALPGPVRFRRVPRHWRMYR